ncbi:hypothetical protein EVJ58_g188 [Rhodofomes roseus]|uniref:Uncharacterized protein n=1 Tax=Rhodofomes roseus TaxID=34475 RepID=A0A4Y9Z709_9APHY|nr:hypothetical protein EVJ58_g188 [Rhodofomes roseus]
MSTSQQDGSKRKTLFINDHVMGLVSKKEKAFTGKYTEQIVGDVCKAAIEAST